MARYVKSLQRQNRVSKNHREHRSKKGRDPRYRMKRKSRLYLKDKEKKKGWRRWVGIRRGQAV